MSSLRKARIALIGFDEQQLELLKHKLMGAKQILHFQTPFDLYRHFQHDPVSIVISGDSPDSASGLSLMHELRRGQAKLVFLFMVTRVDEPLRKYALRQQVSDVYDYSVPAEALQKRLQYLLLKKPKLTNHSTTDTGDAFRLPLHKRAFDIVFAGSMLLLLSPLLLLVGILVKLESPGPVIYYSSRVGMGYRVFRFYKFRSMRLNADRQLKSMGHLNQYDQKNSIREELGEERCYYCSSKNIPCRSQLYADGKSYCEFLYHTGMEEQEGAAFVKIKNDPRITRIGKFIRNTSIDELPQLYNVLKGDMSVVGNRPLPLYEAEKLTTDQFSQRFHAPAGITGLWQVSKRGKGKMTEEERIALDNRYASNYSLRLDLKILFRTVFALLQKENV
jgi:lipopolysaccharide/colanic/teichoic acid biosynthesis glycosyltransferase